MVKLTKRRKESMLKESIHPVVDRIRKKDDEPEESSSEDDNIQPSLYRIRRGVSGFFRLQPDVPKLVSTRRLLGIDYLDGNNKVDFFQNERSNNIPEIQISVQPIKRMDPLQAIIHSLEARIQTTGFVAHPDSLVSRRNRKKIMNDIYDAEDDLISDTEIEAQLADISDDDDNDDDDDHDDASSGRHSTSSSTGDPPPLFKWLRPKRGVEELGVCRDKEDEDESEKCHHFRSYASSELSNSDSYLSHSGDSSDCAERMKAIFHSDDESAYMPVSSTSRSFFQPSPFSSSDQHQNERKTKKSITPPWEIAWSHLERALTTIINNQTDKAATTVTGSTSNHSNSNTNPPFSTDSNKTIQENIADLPNTAQKQSQEVCFSNWKSKMESCNGVSLSISNLFSFLLSRRDSWQDLWEKIASSLEMQKSVDKKIDVLKRRLPLIWKVLAGEHDEDGEDDEDEQDGPAETRKNEELAQSKEQGEVDMTDQPNQKNSTPITPHLPLALADVENRVSLHELLVQGGSIVETCLFFVITTLVPSLNAKGAFTQWWRVEAASQAVRELNHHAAQTISSISKYLSEHESVREVLIWSTIDDLRKRESKRRANAAIKAAKAAAASVAPPAPDDHADVTSPPPPPPASPLLAGATSTDPVDLETFDPPLMSYGTYSLNVVSVTVNHSDLLKERSSNKHLAVPVLTDIHPSICVLEALYKARKALCLMLKKAAPVRWRRMIVASPLMLKLASTTTHPLTPAVDSIVTETRQLLQQSVSPGAVFDVHPLTVNEKEEKGEARKSNIFILSLNVMLEEMKSVKTYLNKVAAITKKPKTSSNQTTQADSAIKTTNTTSKSGHSSTSRQANQTGVSAATVISYDHPRLGPTRRRGILQLAKTSVHDVSPFKRYLALLFSLSGPLLASAETSAFVINTIGDEYCSLTLHLLSENKQQSASEGGETGASVCDLDAMETPALLAASNSENPAHPNESATSQVISQSHSFTSLSDPSLLPFLSSLPFLSPCELDHANACLSSMSIDDPLFASYPKNLITIEHIRFAVFKALLYRLPFPTGLPLLEHINIIFKNAWASKPPAMRIPDPPCIPESMKSCGDCVVFVSGNVWVSLTPQGELKEVLDRLSSAPPATHFVASAKGKAKAKKKSPLLLSAPIKLTNSTSVSPVISFDQPANRPEDISLESSGEDKEEICAPPSVSLSSPPQSLLSRLPVTAPLPVSASPTLTAVSESHLKPKSKPRGRPVKPSPSANPATSPESTLLLEPDLLDSPPSSVTTNTAPFPSASPSEDFHFMSIPLSTQPQKAAKRKATAKGKASPPAPTAAVIDSSNVDANLTSSSPSPSFRVDPVNLTNNNLTPTLTPLEYVKYQAQQMLQKQQQQYMQLMTSTSSPFRMNPSLPSSFPISSTHVSPSFSFSAPSQFSAHPGRQPTPAELMQVYGLYSRGEIRSFDPSSFSSTNVPPNSNAGSGES